MGGRFLLSAVILASGILLAGQAQADFPSVPKETYEALKLERSASPKELYEALVKRYLDPELSAGKGVFGQYWEPVTFSKYFDPKTFYKPPQAVKEVASREQCVKCHTDESPGWVAAFSSKRFPANTTGTVVSELPAAGASTETKRSRSARRLQMMPESSVTRILARSLR
mgnify:CR=1 FL=1